MYLVKGYTKKKITHQKWNSKKANTSMKQQIHRILLSNKLLKGVQCGGGNQSDPLLSGSCVDASS